MNQQKLRQLLVSATQVSCSMGLGDVVCQFLEQPHQETATIDLKRTSRMFVTGFFVSGPWNHCQYQLLERFAPGNAGLTVLKKVLASAALAPISISLMFASVLSLQNRSDEIPNKLQNDLIQTWTVGAAYWPFVLGLNFMYVPLQHRPLVGAAAGSLWNVYNSFQANKAVDVPGDLATVTLEEERVVAEIEHGAGEQETKRG